MLTAPIMDTTHVRCSIGARNHQHRTARRPELQRPLLPVPDRPTGAGVSAQVFALRRKLLEVDAWVRNAGVIVVEVHPEVSFACRPLLESKRTWAGVVRRRRLLAQAGIVLDDDLGPTGSAAVDDILDAAIAAWTARRVARNKAEPLPDPPQVFSDSTSSAIWT